MNPLPNNGFLITDVDRDVARQLAMRDDVDII